MPSKFGAPNPADGGLQRDLECQIYKQRSTAGFGQMASRFGAPNLSDRGLRADLAGQMRPTDVYGGIWRARSAARGLRADWVLLIRPTEVCKRIWRARDLPGGLRGVLARRGGFAAQGWRCQKALVRPRGRSAPLGGRGVSEAQEEREKGTDATMAQAAKLLAASKSLAPVPAVAPICRRLAAFPICPAGYIIHPRVAPYPFQRQQAVAGDLDGPKGRSRPGNRKGFS